MKKILVALLLTACAVSVFGQGKRKPGGKNKGTTAKAIVADSVIKKGEPLGANPAAVVVSLADVLKDPAAYAGKTIRVEGVIERSCKNMGCWMEIAATKGGDTVRAETKHKFFIPLDAAGMKIKAEGTVEVKTISKEEAEHMASEGAKLKLNPDGTATEISFVATGVELSK
jgi:hypothetical protein